MANAPLSSFLQESRRFSPPQAFVAKSRMNAAQYEELCRLGQSDPESFWAQMAQKIVWRKPWHTTLDWKLPKAQWFVGGELNVNDSCLDQHLLSHRRHKHAIIWEGEQGELQKISYEELHRKVCDLAVVLKKNGVKAHDRVAIYLPLIPEAVIAMLACARIGAIHSVVFGGFSAQSLRDRIEDAACRMVITADGGYRKGEVLNLKRSVDEALAEGCESVAAVLVYQRSHQPVAMKAGRDHWWHEEVAALATHELMNEALAVDSEHPLFILYTSGTTGKPKGIVHSTGGYLTQVAATTSWVFDLKDEDIFWCTADVGWITGHSYVVYGPLACGATIFLYEGALIHPSPSRVWEMIERHQISIFYTAPTAIRTFMRFGEEHVTKHDLSSLRLLGSVGEPINPEAWIWYHQVIGQKNCPIVDTWWQTETGAMMIAPIPAVTTTLPGSATKPLPGIHLDIVDQDGKPCSQSQGGYLVATKPWPSMARGIWGDDARFSETYWAPIPGHYFTGDGAHSDDDGNFWIMGRIDDVVNVSGHRIGTMEVESALVSHPHVAEAAVVARPDSISGQAIVAFVVVRDGIKVDDALFHELLMAVTKQIGSFAKPAAIRFTKALPKTRSGKIMRRLLRELATDGRVTGDVSTLEDFSTLAALFTEQE